MKKKNLNVNSMVLHRTFSMIFIATLLLFVGIQASAHDFEAKNSDGKYIYYNYINGSTGSSVSVTSYIKYSGNVVIPETVTCNGMTYNVTNICDNAFYGCTSLTSVTIPESVTSIGYNAFYGCSGLTSVTIGNSVTSIGKNAFKGCSNLTSVIWNAVNYPDFSSSSDSPFYNISTKITQFNIGPNVTNIPAYICYGMSNLSSITIPEGVTSIGDMAFSYCDGLTSVTIPESMTEIGYAAFYYCNGLTSISIPNNVISIGRNAFYSTKLKSLTIGIGVQSIGSYAFGYDSSSYGAKPTKVIWLTNTPPDGYKYADGTINYVANDSYTGLSNVKKYPFLSSMFEVGGIKYVPVSLSERTCDAIDCADNETAENINIGNAVSYKGIAMTVKNVNPYVCCGNNYIKSVDWSFEDSVSSFAFQGCSSLNEVSIGNGVANIPNSSFSACTGLSKITLGNGITSINDTIFSDCTGLKTLILKGGKYDELQIDNKALSSCPLDSVYIGRNITYSTTSSAGYSPFYRNTTLRTVHITSKETEISENEFYGCTNLKNITIGDGVKTIGSYAFSGCSSLEYFACGTQVDSIGKEAFSDCTAMTTFRSKVATPPRCGQQALDDINKWECTLQVPRPSIEAYQGADQWKNFFFVETKPADKGDANGDDAISMADANVVVNYFLAKGTSQSIDDNFDEDAADVNNDGQVTMADANQIVNMFLEGEK